MNSPAHGEFAFPPVALTAFQRFTSAALRGISPPPQDVLYRLPRAAAHISQQLIGPSNGTKVWSSGLARLQVALPFIEPGTSLRTKVHPSFAYHWRWLSDNLCVQFQLQEQLAVAAGHLRYFDRAAC